MAHFSLKAKLLILVDALVIIAVLSMGLIPRYVAKNTLTDSVHTNLSNLSESVSKQIEDLNDAEFTLLHALAEIPLLKDENASLEEKWEMLHGMTSIDTEKINATGASLTEIAGKMRTSIDHIGSQIDQFKV